MDCRTFHQKMEDYLEDGLDFSGRFGMERHAHQCLSCGKELADEQRLKRMVSELQRVKAPANFESFLLGKIASQKAHSRFWSIRKFWIYGLDWLSWRKMVLASTVMAVISIGIFYSFHRPTGIRVSNPPVLINEPAGFAVQESESDPDSAPNVEKLLPARQPEVKLPGLAQSVIPKVHSEKPESALVRDEPDMDYVEYLLPGPDNYAVPVRLPKKIPMRYSQMSEEYFIQNVSH